MTTYFRLDCKTGNKVNDTVKIVENKYGDKYINVINDNHFKNLSAEEVVTAILLSKLNEEGNFYVFIGTDSGLLPKYLDKLPHKEKNKFLFIELDEIIPVIQEQINAISSQNILITNLSDWRNTAVSFGIEAYIYNDKVRLFASLAASEGHIDNYNDLYEILKQSLSSINFEFNARTGNMAFYKEGLLNIADNIYPAEMLRNSGDSFALVIGAGPSLEEHIDWIKNNQHKITILAVSRVCEYLIKNQIKPNLVVSVDPQEMNYLQSKGVLQLSNSILLHSYHVNYKLLSQFAGDKYFLGNRFFWDSTNNLKNFYSIGPTVSHTAITSAMQMGFTKILLTGVDFCYGEDGQSHVSGILRDKTNDLKVLTYDGQERYTTQDFLLSIRTLESIAKSFSGKIYNLSKHAAKCDSIEFTFYPEEIKTAFNGPNKDPNEKINEIKNHLSLSEKELIKAEKKYSLINSISQEALSLNLKWFNLKKQNNVEQIKLKLDVLEKKLNSKKLEPYIKSCRTGAGRKFFSLLNKSRKLKDDQHEYEWLKEYYEAHLQSSKLILALINNAKLNILDRKNELKNNIDISILIESWRNKDILGRSCVFQKLYLNDKNSKDEIDLINQACRSFLSDLNKDHD